MSDDEPPGETSPGEPPSGESSWALERPRRRRVWPWILGVFGSLLIVASIVASFVQLPYYTIAPGDALDVNQLVTVKGARHFEPKGAVMLLFVRERSRINGWRWLQASLDSQIDMVKERDFAGPGVDPAELDAAATADMASSQSYAKYVALRRLGYDVPILPRTKVTATIAGRPAAAVLKPGDTFVSIDGKSVKTPEDVAKAFTSHKPGDRVTVKYLRGGRQATATLQVAADSKGHPIIGVFLAQPFKFPFDVQIDTSDIGGPSAGLAMTLSVLDSLTPGNLTGNQRVAVTGTIGPDGSVGEVGGVGQKAVAARHRGAQLFLVPYREVAEARARAGSLPVVGVRTLSDALKALQKAGGDPLPKAQAQAAA